MTQGWVDRLIGGRRRERQREPGAPGEREPEAGADPVDDTGGGPLRVAWHGTTDRGRVRTRNEDSYSGAVFGEWSLFVVADGMGGHDAGEVASRIAVETVCREIGEGMRQKEKAPLVLVEQALQRANSRVNQEGAGRGSNMGTTLAVALLTGTTASIANVGDSRVYWARGGSLTQVTRDHSLVADMVAAGELTKERARNHPKSSILYRTVGRPERIAVDTFQVALNEGGALLLCTDGLWGKVSDEEIGEALASGEAARTVCETLVGVANARGGEDNITAVVVRVSRQAAG